MEDMERWGNLTSVVDIMSAFTDSHSGDRRVADMFLMSSPIPTSLLVVAYTLAVKSIGPKLMENRKPYNIKSIIAIYNVSQVIFNAWLFAESLYLWCKYYGWGLSCLPVQPKEFTDTDIIWAARVCHLYFMNKLIDLLDTIFFVLRKKHDKISVLHVFHHAVMPISTWFGVKFHPGGNLAFFALPNLFVHIWMYTYYSIANLGPQYQKYTWWKRHLTELQLVQFVLVAAYLGYTSYVCDLNKILVTWIIVLDILFIYMFLNFYYHSYTKRQHKSKIGKEKELEEKTQ